MESVELLLFGFFTVGFAFFYGFTGSILLGILGGIATFLVFTFVWIRIDGAIERKRAKSKEKLQENDSFNAQNELQSNWAYEKSKQFPFTYEKLWKDYLCSEFNDEEIPKEYTKVGQRKKRLEKSFVKRLHRLSDFDWVQKEFEEIKQRNIGRNSTELRFCSPFPFHMYCQGANVSYNKRWENLIYSFFNYCPIAVDYFLRNEYRTNRYLSESERLTLSNATFVLTKDYRGNLDKLSFEEKMKVIKNLSIIVSLYEKYVKFASTRRNALLLQDKCPEAFDFLCIKYLHKSHVWDFEDLDYFEDWDCLTFDELEELLQHKDECMELSANWNRIDYNGSMHVSSDDDKEVITFGERAMRSLPEFSFRANLSSFVANTKKNALLDSSDDNEAYGNTLGNLQFLDEKIVADKPSTSVSQVRSIVDSLLASKMKPR